MKKTNKQAINTPVTPDNETRAKLLQEIAELEALLLSQTAKKGDSRTPAQRSEAAYKASATKTPEQRSNAARKAWITIRANRALAAQAASDTADKLAMLKAKLAA